MKLVISDFDGTMYPYNDEAKRIPAINLEGIKRWREAGEAFVFCTGRNLLSMLFEIKKNAIGYDYLICNSGALIVDQRGKVLVEKLIAPKVLKELIGYIDYTDCIEIMVSTMDKMEVAIFQEKSSKLLKYFKDANYRIPEGVQRFAKVEEFSLEGVTQFTLAMKDMEATQRIVQDLSRRFADSLQINYNLNYIDICALGVNKVGGIEELLRNVPKYQGAEIITIGDAHNDVEMLKAYKGYSLDDATEEAKAAAVATFPNVGSMLLAELEGQ